MTSKDHDHQVVIKRLRGDLLSRERCWDIITELNSEAYDHTYQQWVAAGDNETRQEEASSDQLDCFRDAFYELEQEQRDSIWHWVDNDSKFKDQFAEWFGDTSPDYRM
jgi:hypothetical protein